ncbi:MAG TPA: Gfo/Idh/MocA family oxidoreductase, partial [Blastocatellia bacterium]|nr:Gfo/Idh/MocA family oxidoreductase [Blastocatellia bacterium]
MMKEKRSRREFLKSSTVAAMGATIAGHFKIVPGAYAAGSDEIRIGLIGCGGRGTGAVINALSAAPGVKLVAMADAFKDRLEESRKNLATGVKRLIEKSADGAKLSDKLDVTDDRCHAGLDAYQKVIALKEVNYIILATPPGFRPTHLEAAVAAGKNIFTEKPVAVDGPGIR